jgi:hypothetical protein
MRRPSMNWSATKSSLIEGVNCAALRQGDYGYLPNQGSCGLTVPFYRFPTLSEAGYGQQQRG